MTIPHTTARRFGKNDELYQEREYDSNGNPKTDIDHAHPDYHPELESPHKHDWEYNPETGQYERSKKPYNDPEEDPIEEFSMEPIYQIEPMPQEINWLIAGGLLIWAIASPDPFGEVAFFSYFTFA